jgi:hypothetical protein
MSEQQNPDRLDELLSALIDGELDEAGARELERRIAADPALAERYAALEAANRRFARAVSRIDETPVPDTILKLLSAAADAPRSTASRDAAVAPRSSGATPAWRLPLAAGIALVVGFLAAQLLHPEAPDSAGPPALTASGRIGAASPLYDVLRQVPSGTAARAGDATATPVITFETVTGGYCRELSLRAPDGASRVLACHHDGDWRLRVVEFLPVSFHGYQTAAAADSPVTAAVRRLMHGPPLDAEEEAALIEGWQR